MGRESRQQLLAPSFLIMATALACGGTVKTKSDGDLGNVDLGPSGGSGGTTSSGTSGSAPIIAGSGSNPPQAFPEPCPATLPASGAMCSGSQTCMFEGACTPVQASCVANRWRLEAAAVACNPPAPVCPATLPAAFSPCDDEGLLCRVDDARCYGGIQLIDCTNGTWRIDTCPRLPTGTGEGGAAGAFPDAGAPSFAGDSSLGGAGGAR